MVILTIIIATLFLLWATHGLIEHLRDRRFRSATRNSLHENWRQVPPPNWRSSRGGREYW
jgi:uncharacterized membrane protein